MTRSLFLYAAMMFAFADLLASNIAAAERPLRIVAFNVECLQSLDGRDTRIPRYRWKYARQRHIEKVADVIETLDPDVICLVEVTSKAALDAVVNVLHEKGMTGYAGYHVESQDQFTGFDVAFITRHKPDTIEGEPIRLIYSPADDDTWREDFTFVDREGETKEWSAGVRRHALMCATIGETKIGFLGLHLKSDPSDDYSNARRTAEAKVAQRIIEREIVARGYQPVVLGDLNDYDPDVPDRDVSRSTRTDVIGTIKDFDGSQSGAELWNTGAMIRRVADRYTSHWDVNENGAADIGDVYTTIDYILVPTAWTPHVKRSFVCRLTELNTSDHWPIVVDVELP